MGAHPCVPLFLFARAFVRVFVCVVGCSSVCPVALSLCFVVTVFVLWFYAVRVVATVPLWISPGVAVLVPVCPLWLSVRLLACVFDCLFVCFVGCFFCLSLV